MSRLTELNILQTLPTPTDAPTRDVVSMGLINFYDSDTDRLVEADVDVKKIYKRRPKPI